MFGDLFGGARRGRSQQQPGRAAGAPTSRPRATIGFTDALDGVTISLRLTSDAACPDCHGTGGKPGTTPHICPECEGAGLRRQLRPAAAFSINETCPALRRPPAGLRRGLPDLPRQRPRHLGPHDPGPHPGRGQGRRSGSGCAGKGGAGENGGPHRRPLRHRARSRPHRLFGRKGDNLTLDVPVSFDEAALGAEIKIPTLGGAPVTLKVPAGTPNGRTFRVRGRGATKKDGTKGDLLATVAGAGAGAARTTPPARPSRPTAPRASTARCAPTSSSRPTMPRP